jgi:hypothetical protein
VVVLVVLPLTLAIKLATVVIEVVKVFLTDLIFPLCLPSSLDVVLSVASIGILVVWRPLVIRTFMLTHFRLKSHLNLLIIILPRLRINQNLIGLLNSMEFFLVRLLSRNIRVVILRQLIVCLLNLDRVGIRLNSQCCIVRESSHTSTNPSSEQVEHF